MAESFPVHLSEPQVDKMHPVLRRSNCIVLDEIAAPLLSGD